MGCFAPLAKTSGATAPLWIAAGSYQTRILRCDVENAFVLMSAGPMTPDIERALELAFPGENARYFSPMTVGSTPESADDGAAAIFAGIKTTTSSGLWDWPDARTPFAGCLCVLLDGQGRMRAIIETVHVEIIPFGSVDETLARSYGEGDRTLHWWRSAIGDTYRREAARHGLAFSDDTPFIFEWIVVARRL